MTIQASSSVITDGEYENILVSGLPFRMTQNSSPSVLNS